MPPLEPLDEFRYHHRLREAGGVALVLFSSAGCGTCRVVERRLPEATPAGMHLFRVDVQESLGLARAFEVFHLPALLLYRDGAYHARLECEMSAPALRAAVSEALAAAPQEEP